MNRTLHFLITERKMRFKAYVVIQLAIACHLTATLFTRPRLCSFHQRTPDGLQTQIGINVPAFDITDAAGVAAFGVIPNTRFEKATKLAVVTFGNEDRNISFRLLEVFANLPLMVVI